MYREYEEILKRCKEQGVDTTNCHVYISDKSLDGQPCLKGTLSQDKCWLCIPVREYDEFMEEEYYVPRCFEVKDSFTTYLQGDSVWYLVNVYLLYKE